MAVNISDELVNRWVYDVERILKRALQDAVDRLRSCDEKTAELAEQDIAEILDWLLPPPKPISKEAKLQKIKELCSDSTILTEKKTALIEKVLHSTGRPKGRPRTETAQHAIQAYSLHLATPLSWREIALKVIGCRHDRPNPERSCICCGDAIRDAVGRLENFLKRKGYHPNLPRRIDLDNNAASEVKQNIPEV